MRLAIVADWLSTYGGAEHVLASLHELWPSSPIFTTVASPEKLGPLQDADIRTDAKLSFVYRFLRKHQPLLPWMPRAMERIDLTGYDVVLSSSHAVAKGVIPPSTAFHLCYCHTPMRYAWEMEEEYLKDFGIRGFLKKKVKAELKKIRRWDLFTAKRVDRFIANSTETQKRIQRIYGRESVVIPPPVEGRFFEEIRRQKSEGSSYFLAIGRLVPYKKFDLLIELANRSKLPLKIAGRGSEEARLKAMAGPTVEFLGFVPDAELPSLYAGASALFFPQMEDAGIVPMEAQACGTPVIAFGQGGVTDVIMDGRTGVLTDAQTVESFERAVTKFSSLSFDRAHIREHARTFHVDRFKERMRAEVDAAGRALKEGYAHTDAQKS